MSPNQAWLSNPPEAYLGKWVLLENGKPLAAAFDRARVAQAAKKTPLRGARLIMKIPETHQAQPKPESKTVKQKWGLFDYYAFDVCTRHAHNRQ